MRRPKGVSAWLVTWEWCGDHAKPQNKVAEILDPRLSPERVREIVELLYHKDALLSEKIAWRLRRHQHPYPAEFPRFHGVRWKGEITCGHNPWLRARIVDDLVIESDGEGQETATWMDRNPPRKMAERIRFLQQWSPGGEVG